MLKRNVLFAALVGCAALVLSGPISQAQQNTTPLTATDYAEIMHVYARYAHAFDSKAGDGALLASVYTPDGFFRTGGDTLTTSRTDLINTYGHSSGASPATIVVGHTTFNVMIEPGPSGAIGYAYFNDGSYIDMLVKTPEGWQFKARNWRPALAFPQTRAPR